MVSSFRRQSGGTAACPILAKRRCFMYCNSSNGVSPSGQRGSRGLCLQLAIKEEATEEELNNRDFRKRHKSSPFLTVYRAGTLRALALKL